MAPPRQQRNAANHDDSRSETSSGPKERSGGAPKGRRAANPATGASNTMTTKEMKVAAATTAANLSAEPEVDQSSTNTPGIPWTQMPLEILHDYRHAYNLSTPSAYSSPIAPIVLSQGIGLQSPTSIAARRTQSQSSSSSQQDRQRLRKGKKEEEPTRRESTDSRSGKDSGSGTRQRSERNLHRIAGSGSGSGNGSTQAQGRVSKEHLALAVRKHFNNIGLVEPEAIARFLYKVREEGKGREFRLRFQP